MKPNNTKRLRDPAPQH